MSDNKPLQSYPPRPGGGVEAVDSFISGAGIPSAPEPEAPAEAAPWPWEAPGVREDVAKMFNLRLPEPYLLKLKHIAEHTPDSMQQFCLRVLLPAIDARIAELTGPPARPPGAR